MHHEIQKQDTKYGTQLKTARLTRMRDENWLTVDATLQKKF